MRKGDLRPITVMSGLYRLWPAVRVGSVLSWQDGWASPSLLGFRNLFGCEDVLWQMSLDIEQALMEGGEIVRPECGLLEGL